MLEDFGQDFRPGKFIGKEACSAHVEKKKN
jgi:hypothetical protein